MHHLCIYVAHSLKILTFLVQTLLLCLIAFLFHFMIQFVIPNAVPSTLPSFIHRFQNLVSHPSLFACLYSSGVVFSATEVKRINHSVSRSSTFSIAWNLFFTLTAYSSLTFGFSAIQNQASCPLLLFQPFEFQLHFSMTGLWSFHSQLLHMLYKTSMNSRMRLLSRCSRSAFWCYHRGSCMSIFCACELWTRRCQQWSSSV